MLGVYLLQARAQVLRSPLLFAPPGVCAPGVPPAVHQGHADEARQEAARGQRGRQDLRPDESAEGGRRRRNARRARGVHQGEPAGR